MNKKEASFFRTLSEDVFQALQRLTDKSNESDRRNALRTIISATEGLTWICRTHVQSIAEDMETISPIERIALSEVAVSVSETGRLSRQVKHLSMIAAIRLTTNVAQSISPNIHIDFGRIEWENLKCAIKVRNRVTHPKISTDLMVSDQDIEIAKSGFFWFATFAADVMEAITKEYSIYVKGVADVVDDLIKGDPETLAMYRKAVAESED